MRKFLFVAVLSLFLLSACSSEQKYTSVIEAIKSEEINITQIDSSEEAELDGIKPLNYKLDNNEIVIVYDFGSKEKREIGYKRFQEYQKLSSTSPPIVYQSSNYLIFYYYHIDINANSTAQTPNLTETKYGEKIKKALNSIE